jgi:hypothetical protein
VCGKMVVFSDTFEFLFEINDLIWRSLSSHDITDKSLWPQKNGNRMYINRARARARAHTHTHTHTHTHINNYGKEKTHDILARSPCTRLDLLLGLAK